MDETYDIFIRHRLKMFDEWMHSLEYKNLCSMFLDAAENLVRIGKCHVPCCAELESGAVARTEIATGSGLHRGFYCPSLTEDIVVGNVHRGRLLKRLSPKRKWYFVYGFDRDDKLILSQMYYNGKLAEEEHLFYDGDRVYGVTQSPDGGLIRVASETYLDGEIMCYERAEISPWDEKCKCFKMYREEYIYVSDHLKVCYRHDYSPASDFNGLPWLEEAMWKDLSFGESCLKDALAIGIHRKTRYTFDWHEDCMTGYLAEHVIGANDEIVTGSGYYSINKPR